MLNKISIIIPIYNSEKFLIKCLDSLLKQSEEIYELILVNDGSTDSSSNIINQYAEKYKCIHIINQINSGVSVARNKGMDLATGDYIMFIDADDWVSNNIVEQYLSTIKKTKSDCLIGEWNEVKYNCNVNKRNKALKYISNESTEETKKRTIDHYFKSREGGAPWAKLFCRDIIKKNSLKFVENLPLGEDYLFVLNYIIFCKKIVLVEQPMYFYRMDELGAATKNRKNYFDIQLFIESEKTNIMKKANLNILDFEESLVNTYMKCCNNSYINIFKSKLKLKVEEIRKIVNNEYSIKIVKLSYKYKLIAKYRIIRFLMKNKFYISIYVLAFIQYTLQKVKTYLKVGL